MTEEALEGDSPRTMHFIGRDENLNGNFTSKSYISNNVENSNKLSVNQGIDERTARLKENSMSGSVSENLISEISSVSNDRTKSFKNSNGGLSESCGSLNMKKEDVLSLSHDRLWEKWSEREQFIQFLEARQPRFGELLFI